MMASRKKVLFTKRFYPAGTYTWTVPAGCDSVDVFLVGAGGGAGQIHTGSSYGGGGGGYTKTYRGTGYIAPSSGTWVGTSTEGRDGNAISVTPGQQIEIIVGAGASKSDGGYSQFMNSSYRANGGVMVSSYGRGGNGGSGGSGEEGDSYSSGPGGSDGSDGIGTYKGYGQGHTTRDFGEPTGLRNAGGGSGASYYPSHRYSGGASDYSQGSGQNFNSCSSMAGGSGGGGYGGGAGGTFGNNASTKGGDGTVLIRYYAYE